MRQFPKEAVVARDETDTRLQRIQKTEVVTTEVLLMDGEQDDPDAQSRQDDEVDNPVEGNQAQHVEVSKWPASKRQLDLGALGWEPAGRRSRRSHGQPRVAPEAPVPTQAVGFADQNLVLGAHLSSVCADKLVAVEPTAEELPPQLRSKSSRGLCPRQPRQFRRAIETLPGQLRAPISLGYVPALHSCQSRRWGSNRGVSRP